MASDELPSGSDPYEILGISPDADAITLKRAYIRLIRKFKPERDPDSFRRIREAYELAELKLKQNSLFSETLGDSNRFETDADLDSDDNLYPPFENISPEELEMLISRLPDSSSYYKQRYLLGKKNGEDPASLSRWPALALQEGISIAEWIYGALEPEEIRSIALQPEVTWECLRKQSARWARAQIFRTRIGALIGMGRLDTALVEISQKNLSYDVSEDPTLSDIILDVACAVLWDFPEKARKLYQEYEETADRSYESCMADVFWQLLEIREHWLLWREGLTREETLIYDFLRLSHVVDQSSLNELISNLARDIGRHPGVYLRAFERMYNLKPVLLDFFIFCAEDIADDEGKPFEAHSSREKKIIQDFSKNAEKKLTRKDFWSYLNSWAYGVMFIGAGASLVALGWWGLIPLAAALGLSFVLDWRMGERLFQKKVRPAVFNLVIKNGISPGVAAEFIEKYTNLAQNLGAFADEIKDDIPMRALYLGVRLRYSLTDETLI